MKLKELPPEQQWLSGFTIGFYHALDLLRATARQEGRPKAARGLIVFANAVEESLSDREDFRALLGAYTTPELRAALVQTVLNSQTGAT